MYLHGQRCAGSFVLRLARDAWQVEHEQGPAPQEADH
jgi:hypothetical protein